MLRLSRPPRVSVVLVLMSACVAEGRQEPFSDSLGEMSTTYGDGSTGESGDDSEEPTDRGDDPDSGGDGDDGITTDGHGESGGDGDGEATTGNPGDSGGPDDPEDPGDPDDPGDPGDGGTGSSDPGTTSGESGDAGGDDDSTTSSGDDGGACGAPDGAYGDCVNGSVDACGDPSAGCLVDDNTGPSIGVCFRECADDCDCWDAPASGTAPAVCAPVLAGGAGACVLDCSQGQSCPTDMACNTDFGLCVYEVEETTPPVGGDVPDTPHCAPVANWPADWAQLEEEVLVLTNQMRAQGASCGGQWYGPTGPVTMHPVLRCSARLHSLDMATNGFFSHDNLQGVSAFDRMAGAGYDYSTAGENIAAGQTSAADVIQAWLDSPGHCQILMHPNFEHLGVGYAYQDASHYRRYWTQNFGAQ